MSDATGAPEAGAAAPAPVRRSAGAAALVGFGIFLSRIAGFVRQRALAQYLGTSASADAFVAALRIPNLLQNLFGEGALSASMVPVYAGLLARGDEAGARRVASAIAGLLALVTAALVLIGMLATPLLVDLIVGGFEGAQRALTIQLVRILFPGIGLLVMSAWCLGVLNSHRRYFLSYVSPVLWNAAIIGALVWNRGLPSERLAIAAAWGAVIGSLLQLLVQLPTALRLLGGFHAALGLADAHVRTVLRNFAPAATSRGVVQLSAYVDTYLASRVATGAVTAVFNAQVIYTLPVSLFGMSVSVAELTAMSRETGGGEAALAARLRARLDGGLARIAFFVIPSAVAFAALGDVLAGALFQAGRFGRGDVEWVWGILAGASIGLLAATLARLYASTLFSLKDTRAPLRYAMVRIAAQVALGWVLSAYGPAWLGLAPRWGAVGLTVAASIGAWIEFALLRRDVARRVGAPATPGRVGPLWIAALVAAAVAWGTRYVAVGWHPIATAFLVLPVYGVVYFSLTLAFRTGEAHALVGRVARRLRR